MKLSVSLSDEDVAILDRYVADEGLPSRSAALQVAVRQLRDRRLEDDYQAAWQEWEDSGEAQLWEASAGDGLADAPR